MLLIGKQQHFWLSAFWGDTEIVRNSKIVLSILQTILSTEPPSRISWPGQMRSFKRLSAGIGGLLRTSQGFTTVLQVLISGTTEISRSKREGHPLWRSRIARTALSTSGSTR